MVLCCCRYAGVLIHGAVLVQVRWCPHSWCCAGAGTLVSSFMMLCWSRYAGVLIHGAVLVQARWCPPSWCCTGAGTLVSSFMVLCCGSTTRSASRGRAFALNLLVAFLQFATFIFIVGWVWSITWGMAFVQLARQYPSFSYLSLRGRKYFPSRISPGIHDNQEKIT